ncbi:two-component system C4-dicarboxylate transport response regulator DctD [Cereibacter changlensis]|nr:two-component system C4-dicarboxylate transport response regulator DctD [Cereibacter changlensis]
MLVEDDADLAQATAETLESAGFVVEAHASAAPALAALGPDWPGVVLSDLRMPGMSGLDMLDRARVVAPAVPFIVITGHGDVAAAIRAMRAGAHDFLEKPCDPDLLIDILRRAVEMRRLQLENAALRQRLASSVLPTDRLLGRSPVMQDLRRRVAALAGLRVDLLIAGESGTGKELVARCLHDMSARREGPFVALNCGALTEADVDRELFGVAGEHPGRIASAQGGTLYLDELESMPDALQVRLLRVLEAREITPLGGPARAVDLRILGSVKADPAALIAEGRLRADLYHRFNAGALKLPPLREREGDALLLIGHFADEAAARHNLPKPVLSPTLRRQAEYHHWPGNVREARNLAERLVIGLEPSFAPIGGAAPVPVESYDRAMESFENRLLQAALLQTGGRKAEAAELLGIPRKRLYLRLRQHGLA